MELNVEFAEKIVRQNFTYFLLLMAAVEALIAGKTDVMIGKINNEICYTPLQETWETKKPISNWMIELSDLLP